MESGLETHQVLTSENIEPQSTSLAEPTAALNTEVKVSKLDWLLLLSTLLISCGLYLVTFPREFTNWDDPEYIVNNPLIRSLSLQNLNKIITEPYFANYAPLTLLSYALDYSLWKLNPAGYHLHNLLLHLGCVVALFFLLRQFSLPRFVVLGSVVLFAIHPANVETVSWASERKNLLATFFFFLSFHQYIQYRKQSDRLNFLLSVFCFLLSLLSKASTVVAPLVFLTYDYAFRERKIMQLSLYDKLPFIVLAEVHAFFSIHAAGAHRALHSYHHGGSLLSAFASGHLFEEYLKLLLFPADLSGFYYPRESPSFGAVAYWLPLMLCLAALGLLARLSRPLFFWFASFIILMIPVLNIVPLPIQMANRYLYISQAGIWVLLVIGARWLWKSCRSFPVVRAAFVGMTSLWVLWLGIQTTQFNQTWKNSELFWTRVIDQDFYNEIAHFNLGMHYKDQGNVNRAGLEFWHALAIHPKYHLALSGLGVYYFDKGETELARLKFHAALNAFPDFDVASNNLGRVYVEQGKLQHALYFFYRATYLNPNNIRALTNIAVLYQRINRLDGLEETAGVILRRFPEAPEGFFRLGLCREAQGRFPEAISAWEESLKRAAAGDPLVQQIESRLGSVRAKVSNSAPHPQYDR
jgi:tetratricopeptide (TPR) repeat protein